jgi:hypothetical protein
MVKVFYCMTDVGPGEASSSSSPARIARRSKIDMKDRVDLPGQHVFDDVKRAT